MAESNFRGPVTSMGSLGRLSMLLNVGIWNQVYATPLNTVPMFGVAQSTSTT